MRILSVHRVKSYFEVKTEAAVYEIDGSLLHEYSLTEGMEEAGIAALPRIAILAGIAALPRIAILAGITALCCVLAIIS